MIVLGSANMDIVVRTCRAPSAGETVLGQDYALYTGGKGANQAVAARRAGAEVVFLGCIGRDAYGDRLVEALAADGIDLGAVRRVETPTGVAFITVEANGENRIIVVPGANQAFLPEHLPETIAGGTVLLAQLEIPIETFCTAAARVRAAGGTVILNASPIAAIEGSSRAALLEATDILLVNEVEAAALLGVAAKIGTLEVATGAAVSLAGSRGTAVVTRGAAGAVWYASGACGHLPGHRVAVVDTTACGDAFAGTFACAIERGEPIAAAVAFANAAGALAATKPGAQISLPGHVEINTFLASHR
jgi:ribokinase